MAQKLNTGTGEWNKTSNWSKTKTDTKGKERTNKDTSDKGGVKDSSSSKKTSTSKATKKANKKTLRTLVGNLATIPNENSIKVVPRSTVKLNGLGKYLSGNYYVESVERTIDSNGYSQSAVVIKTDFRNSLKIYAKYPDEKSKVADYESIYKKNLENYKKKHKNAKPKKHVVKKKETLYTISKKYFKSSRYAKVLGSINKLPKSKWSKLPVGYRLVISKKK